MPLGHYKMGVKNNITLEKNTLSPVLTGPRTKTNFSTSVNVFWGEGGVSYFLFEKVLVLLYKGETIFFVLKCFVL